MNVFWGSFSLLLATALGGVWVAALWPMHPWHSGPRAVRLALAFVLGLGITSAVQLVWIALRLPWLSMPLLEALTAIAGAFVAWYQTRQTPALSPTSGVRQSDRVHSWILWPSFALTMGLFLLACVGHANRNVNGGWDAWAFWNMKARFFFRDPELWARALTEVSPASHPDYPLMLPLSVARMWQYVGNETTVCPIILAGVNSFTLILALAGATAWHRSTSLGLLAATTLLSTHALITHGMSQYADTVLSTLMLLSVALITVERSGPQPTPSRSPATLVLAGLCAALAAWTKNEGQLFVVATFVVVTALAFSQEKPRAAGQRVALFALGAALPLMLVLLQKMAFSVSNDVLAAQTTDDMFSKITDLNRHAMLLRYLLGFVWSIPDSITLSLLLVYAIVAGIRRDRAALLTLAPACGVVAIMLCGYYTVLLITPHDLQFHVGSSIDRLFMHLWPMVIFIFFLLVRRPGEMTKV